MSNALSSRLFPHQPLGAWLKVFAVTICVAIAAATGWYEYAAREDTLRKAETDAGMIAGSLAQHAEDTFETVDVLLTTLSNRLQATQRTPEEIWAIDDALASQLRQVPRIRSIMAYDRAGNQFVTSQLNVPDWFDVSLTESFGHHKAVPGTALLIGKPLKSPTNDDWIIPISRRLNDANGKFEGMMLATIYVTYFSDFYEAFNVNGSAGISLLANDGDLLSRYPIAEDKIGKNYASSPWFKEVTSQNKGTLRFVSPVDGVARVHGYHAVGSYPVTMFVGVGEASILAAWWRGCVINVVAAASLIAVFGILGLKLARQVEIRQLSERTLSQLVKTDGLTGLKNRRAFDEALDAAWAAARMEGTTLSLLLLDVDHFKAFNDTYGHLAGDDCLRKLSAAINQAAFRASDLVARYGGEEFVVLLPDTDQNAAMTVADRVRLAVIELSLQHSASMTSSVVTVSIGVASFDAREAGQDDAASSLVADADRALYKAKYLGRNRVECLNLPATPSLLAPRPAALRA